MKNKKMIEINTKINEGVIAIADECRELWEKKGFCDEKIDLQRGHNALWACADLMMAHIIAGEVYDYGATVYYNDAEEYKTRVLKFIEFVDDELIYEEIYEDVYLIYDEEFSFDEAMEIVKCDNRL